MTKISFNRTDFWLLYLKKLYTSTPWQSDLFSPEKIHRQLGEDVRSSLWRSTKKGTLENTDRLLRFLYCCGFIPIVLLSTFFFFFQNGHKYNRFIKVYVQLWNVKLIWFSFLRSVWKWINISVSHSLDFFLRFSDILNVSKVIKLWTREVEILSSINLSVDTKWKHNLFYVLLACLLSVQCLHTLY